MNIDYSGLERRSSKRAKVNFIITYHVEKPLSLRMVMGLEKEFAALMLDLSEEGMGILTAYNIPVDAILSIKFILIDQNVNNEKFIKIALFGRVCYNLVLEKGERRLGICFTKIDKEDKLRITDFVNRILPKMS